MADGTNGMDRRRFLKVLGVTGGGTAALAGCSTDQVEKLIPYLVPPDNQVPGIATWYASTCRECPAGCGVHVRVREGRAVKVEGNPDHPVNLGRLCARGQASLQGLYNPDRVRQPMARTALGTFEPISWQDAIARIAERMRGISGDQIRFITGYESGTFDRLVNEWLQAFGGHGRMVFEPFGQEALRAGGRQVFGRDDLPRYDFGEARYVLSFGADFLETWLSPVEHARGFADAHTYRDGAMGRYVHIEPRMSMTGMSADEWIAPVPGTEALLALAIAGVIAREGLATAPDDLYRVRSLIDAHDVESAAAATGVPAETIRRLAREFTAVPSLAVAGGVAGQHAASHATAAAVALLNYLAGNVGRGVRYGSAPAATAPTAYREFALLARAMRNRGVGVVFVHGANPVYATPAALDFGGALAQVELTVSFARFMDETAMAADLVLPDHDPLEQWNDYAPYAGVRALQQPVMQPVFDTRQTGDVLLQIVQQVGGTVAGRFAGPTYLEYLRAAWRDVQREVGDRRSFETFWSEALQQGGVWRTPGTERVRLAATAATLGETLTWNGTPGELPLIAYPSPALYDGRGANRPWLQELPDPVTKITWGTWIELHPDTAAEYGLVEGDIVEVRSAAGVVEAPAFPYPGLRPGAVAMPLGQGHLGFGRYAEGRGAHLYRLLPAEPTPFDGMAYLTSVTLRKTGAHERLAKTSGRSRQMDRGIARATTLAAMLHPGERAGEHAAHAAPVPEHIEDVLDQWQERQDRATEYGDYADEHPRWAMSIDLSRCTGCSACVTACHAENNIPTVGPDLVRHGREMSWIRIERYFEGGEHGEPFESRVVPMLCQQCGSAPCEPVCPVYAAYRTPDGLNGQIYNRCVGTRYCSNNCPYKVRYFNYFDYQAEADPYFAFPEPLTWLLNPDVTVRSKGVMEKCTFCVQRIREKQHEAALEGRELRDGELLTACQQTCPSEAIVFGNIRDAGATVTARARDERGYHVLGELNTRPAVTYLAKVRNLVEA